MSFDLLITLQILLVATCGWCAWSRGAALVRGSFHPLNVVTLVHAALSATAVVMQWIWGLPNYAVFVHLRAVNDSRPTWITYYAFSSIVCIVFAVCARYCDDGWRANDRNNPYSSLFHASGWDRALMWLALASPVACSLFTPDWRIWTNYAALLDLQPHAQYATFVNVLYATTYVAVLGACGLILASKTRISQVLPITVFTCAAIWLNGKRNIVMLTLVLVVFSLRIRGVVSRRTTYVLFGAALASFVGYSQWYQSQYRPILSSFDTFYETARMDYTRDADIRMALFAELEQTAASPVLEYRGQSFMFDALFFVPRTVWEDKPKPYYFYMTAAAVDGPRINRSWGIETSFLSEAIANLGLPGLLVGPLFLIAIATSGYRPENQFLNMLTCVICSLFMFIHLAGFTVLWSVWCVFMFSSAGRRGRVKTIRWAEAPLRQM